MTRKCTDTGDTFRNRAASAWRAGADPARPGAETGAGGAPVPDAVRDGASYGAARTLLRQIVGFTLVELLIVIVIIGALAAIAVPNYRKYIERAQIVKTVADLKLLEQEITLFLIDNERYPASLDEIGRGGMLDLWGNPYQYTNISMDLADIAGNTGNSGVGKFRSYLNTKPINTDFDIYSKGPDGKSARPLTSKNSYDDIIRGNNGGYMGVAKEF